MQLTESSEQPCDEDVATPAPANTARELRPPLLEFSNGHGNLELGLIPTLYFKYILDLNPCHPLSLLCAFF